MAVEIKKIDFFFTFKTREIIELHSTLTTSLILTELHNPFCIFSSSIVSYFDSQLKKISR